MKKFLHRNANFWHRDSRSFGKRQKILFSNYLILHTDILGGPIVPRQKIEFKKLVVKYMCQIISLVYLFLLNGKQRDEFYTDFYRRRRKQPYDGDATTVIESW